MPIVTRAIGAEETGYHVIYYSKKPVAYVYQGHLEALGKMGYSTSGNLTSSDAGEDMRVNAWNQNNTMHVLIHGVAKSGSDGNGYWVQINPVPGA